MEHIVVLGDVSPVHETVIETKSGGGHKTSDYLTALSGSVALGTTVAVLAPAVPILAVVSAVVGFGAIFAAERMHVSK